MKTILITLFVFALSHTQCESQCQCVPYYQCSSNGTINEGGAGNIDIRAGSSDDTGLAQKCEHYLDVCCISTDGTIGSNINQGGQESGVSTGNQGNQSDRAHVNKGCGYRNPNGIGFRIIGNYDNEANFGEYPWMTVIFQQENVHGNNKKVYKCGGSLINRRVILTAAHCVHGVAASSLSVRVGEWDTQTKNEPLPFQERNVSVVIIHPDYVPSVVYNDYALLILQIPVDLADNVEVVCLPEQNESLDMSNCYATGWGKDIFGKEGRYQVILKAIQLAEVSTDQCQNSLRATRLGKYFKLHNSFMCAGGISGVDTCSGDGGSPLVCPLSLDPSRFAQAGIVSWGIGCGERNVPGVYADVRKIRNWVDRSLSPYNIDSVGYSAGGNNNYPPAQ